jgi:DNA-binding GntR family transcriptional regulator
MLVEYDQEKPARSVGRMTKTNASVETVLTELRTGIQRGRYAPGQRLITSELATNLKTSRGASVRTLTAQTFIDGLQVLEVVGGLALRLIAPRLKDATVRRSIEHALEPVFEAGRRRNPHDFFTAIAASHRLVNDYSGNAYLNPILTRIHLEYFYRQMADLLPDDFWDRYTENYKITGGLLVRGDARGAERAWRQHVQWVIGLVRQHVN